MLLVHELTPSVKTNLGQKTPFRSPGAKSLQTPVKSGIFRL